MIFNECTQVPLAKDKVRYAGEPLAMVVAESRYLAEDALADIVVRIEPLKAVVDLEAALAPDAPRLHEHLPSNLAAHVHQRKGDYAGARAAADVVIARRFVYDRGAAAAIENRAVAASWNAAQRGADDLGHDPGADSDQERPGPHARPVRIAGAGDRARSSAAASARRS